MSSDTKIGLALGILIVGIASAFFFRPSEFKTTGDRVQQHAPGIKDIDQELAHRANRPYLPPPESDVEGDHEDSSSNPDHFPKLSDILYSGEATAPAPVVLTTQEVQEVTVNKMNLSASPEQAKLSMSEKTSLLADQISSSNLETAQFKLHQVKPGETLSSIAHHYLGSPVRFRDIFELNQDLMDSPDSLRTGMTLKIPQVVHKVSELPERETPVAVILPKLPARNREDIPENIVTSNNPQSNLQPDPIPNSGAKQKRFQAVKKMPGMTVQTVQPDDAKLNLISEE